MRKILFCGRRTAEGLLERVLKVCFSGENYFFACLPLRSKAAKKQFSPEKRSSFESCEAFKTVSEVENLV